MTAMPVAERMTAEEFLALPDRPWSSFHQLIDGVVVVDNPRPLHQGVLGNLHIAVANWTRAASGRGRVWLPLDVRMDDHNVFGPDLLWYAHGRGPEIQDRSTSPIPDLAVEVRSPRTWRHDLGAKRREYERRGLPELWLVDTVAQRILVHRRNASDEAHFDDPLELVRGDTLRSPAMAGFALELDDIFAELPR